MIYQNVNTGVAIGFIKDVAPQPNGKAEAIFANLYTEQIDTVVDQTGAYFCRSAAQCAEARASLSASTCLAFWHTNAQTTSGSVWV